MKGGLPLAEAGALLGELPATLVTRQVIAHAIAAGLKPCLDPAGPHRGSYRVHVDSGGRDGLFGGIDIGARTGRILRAYLMRGTDKHDRRYDQVAEIRAAIRSWADQNPEKFDQTQK